jgi:hypothetical protein
MSENTTDINCPNTASQIYSYTVHSLSIFINTLLFVVIKQNSTLALKQYSIILRIGCIIDIYSSTFQILTQAVSFLDISLINILASEIYRSESYSNIQFGRHFSTRPLENEHVFWWKYSVFADPRIHWLLLLNLLHLRSFHLQIFSDMLVSF